MTSSVDVCRVRGRAFEDILDGYFPLEESIRQLMARQGFASAWITLLHAPVMNIKGLAPTDPVPFSLRKTYAGMIERMDVFARATGEGLQLDGVGRWFWLDPRDEAPRFAPTIRLGEPAFVRGIGVDRDHPETASGQPANTTACVRVPRGTAVASALSSAVHELGWTSGRAWGGYPLTSGIQPAHDAQEPHVLTGEEFTAGRLEGIVQAGEASDMHSYVLVDTSPDQAEKEALELARLL
ncbi:hypothetical protein [Tianweitania sediminis]|uniref:Uncharacterized protein n=1 Tax=Tianweitania sediminis TaxID=1502156 RepID=A0A8J7UJB8_9HYPH|nr:hypothetical protein [Tianweitania sediminis]MBP0438705.1 hypothetical protein [Tianweitania sediminis]